MPKTRQQKEEVVRVLTDKFKNSSAIVFADYQGLTVPQVDELRKKIHENSLTYIVAKKTLINLAAKSANIDLDTNNLPGMIGIAFSDADEVAPAKVLGDVSKESSLKLVGGVFEGKVADQEYVVSLSKLPSRLELYSMLVGTLNNIPGGFVRALDAIKTKKEEDSQSTESSTEKVEDKVEDKKEEKPAESKAEESSTEKVEEKK